MASIDEPRSAAPLVNDEAVDTDRPAPSLDLDWLVSFSSEKCAVGQVERLAKRTRIATSPRTAPITVTLSDRRSLRLTGTPSCEQALCPG